MIFRLDEDAPSLPDDGSAFVAPGAVLVGKVRLGAQASVWFGAVLRGDTDWITVGARSNVQDNAVLHTDPGCALEIAEDCTIGHGAILHGCVIEAGSLIGMGAVVLNRARIGAGSLVGAHALVTEGKAFPPGSLIVGNPARVVRPLDAEARARLLESAAGYVARAEGYRRRLRPLAP